MKKLNLGCGTTYHRDWINMDIVPQSPDIVAHDFTKGLPFDANSIDVCYSSHVLEHLRKEEADLFIREQNRVLKPKGIIRVVVPDLEVICRNYLKYLDEVVAGNTEHEFRYDFSLLELFDQTTRDQSGGEIGKLWALNQIKDKEYAISRQGEVSEDAIKAFQGSKRAHADYTKRIKKIFTKQGFRKAVTKGRQFAALFIVRGLLGKKASNAAHEGFFRNSGEIHRKMYDKYSLKRLLSLHEFIDIRVCSAEESRIPDFNQFQLDAINGTPIRPDSLYMEAVASDHF